MMAIIHSLKCTVPFSFAVPLLSLAVTHCHSLSLIVKRCIARKCDQIRRKLQIWSHLLKKSLMENFIFCALSATTILVPISICQQPRVHRNSVPPLLCYPTYITHHLTFPSLSPDAAGLVLCDLTLNSW